MKRRLVMVMGIFVMALSIILSYGQNVKFVAESDEIIEWNSYSIES